MRMWHKLLLSYLVLAAMAGLIGYIGTSGIGTVSGQFKRVSSTVLPSIEALEELRFGGMRIVSSAVEYALLVPEGTGAGAGAAAGDNELLLVGSDTYRHALTQFITSERRHSHPTGDLIDPIAHAGDAMLKTGNELTVKARLGRSKSELVALKERFQAEERQFLLLLDQALALEKAQLKASQQQVNETIDFARQSIVAGCIAAVLIAFGACLTIGIRFGWALQRLREGAERLSVGDLSSRLPVTTTDEVGQVTNAFNQMAGKLQDAYTEAESSRSYLDNIINSMVEALYVTDLDNTILMINQAACTMLDASSEQVLGRHCASFFASPGQQEEMLVEMLRTGAVNEEEALLKTRDGDIIPVALSGSVLRSGGDVRGIVWLAHDIRERKQAEEDVRRLAFFDSLTDLPNRTLFLDRCNQAINMAGRDNTVIALLLFDLDNFKEINESLGHGVGDQLLQAVALRLQEGIRRSDTLARLGGDEFILMMPNAPDFRSISVVAQKLLGLLTLPFDLEGKELFISASIGVTMFPTDGKESDSLLSHADLALYAAKEKGRNAFCFYSEQMDQTTQERRELEARLRQALQNKEFFLDYQPQYDLTGNRLVSVEALARWRDPERGLIPPDKFIRIAEEAGHIHQLGEWVLLEACRQAQQWQNDGFAPIRVAVNLSGKQFQQANIIDIIDRVLAETSLDPHLLELELTESILMEKAQDTVSILVDFKVRGIKLAIDDFGTGYSSLSYLKFFPLDRLKIDRSFVRDIAEDPDDAAIVNAIIGLSHSLGLKVIAEGVETEEQLSFLKKQGCDEVQGYYFARPLSPEKVAELLTRV